MIILLGVLFMILIMCFSGIGMGMSTMLGFIDFPSFILIAMPLIFFMTVTKTYKSVINYFKCSFKKDYNFSRYELECLSQDVGAIIKVILASGTFGFITGLIILLHNLTDPSSLGPVLAVSLITELYSVMFSFFIFYPVKIWAEHRLRSQSHTEV